ncbi:MAG: hypothetical protein FD130_37, partial [Halothiobacillaceae bacterium]
MGSGSNEIGIAITNGGNATVAEGGILTLTGSGGGLYSNSSGTQNYGVYFNNALLVGGTISVTGIGGMGATGALYGVLIDTSGLTAAVNGNALTFINCTGGQGGNDNCGMRISATLSISNGALYFTNITGGGSSSTGNHGLLIDSGVIVQAPTLVGVDLLGGPGFGTNYGLYLNSGTLGSSTTNILSIQASSLGLGSNEYGMLISGSLIVGNAGTMTLVGSGGGIYSNGSGTANYGIRLSGASITAGTATFTGVGGAGGNGGNTGVVIDTSCSATIA